VADFNPDSSLNVTATELLKSVQIFYKSYCKKWHHFTAHKVKFHQLQNNFQSVLNLAGVKIFAALSAE